MIADDDITEILEQTVTPDSPKTRLEKGVGVIKSHQKHLATAPGVYRMYNKKGDVLYVGKARNLRARVAAYTRPATLPVRIQRMIAETIRMEFTTTGSEAEALLLEAVLIKEHMPRYNILLRDDKSFPYIYISGDHDFPRIAKHRGARDQKGDYFGPFMTTGGAVDQTITALQRAFLIRNCPDTIFSGRTRPCLQYHIKRCSAPCVDYISKDDYAESIAEAREFLKGKHGQIQERFAEKMQQASANMDYEAAAAIRDRIRALTLIQTRQRVHVAGLGDMDIIAAAQKDGKTCIQIFFYRNDQHLGHHAFFPKHEQDEDLGQILAAFVVQFYDDKPIPPEILLSHPLKEQDLIMRALALKTDKTISLQCPSRGKRKDVVDHAVKNAAVELDRVLAHGIHQKNLLEKLAERFALPQVPARIEVYDNSHISGKHALGAMVVAGAEGFSKKSYRKFNIRADETVETPVTGGDDYGMLRQVLERRFARMAKEETEDGESGWVRPDLILIDGGVGQLRVGVEVLEQYGHADIPLIAIAKGPDRNAGRERFFMDGRGEIHLEQNDPVLHYLQRLRDEAHRFAIGGHRKKRTAELGRSELDAIPGVGGARKRALLHHFGSAAAIKRASLQDLQVVKGVNKNLAKRIYAHFHSGAE